MEYKKIILSYQTNALEPYISEIIMSDHYNFNHTAYQNKLNEVIKNLPQVEKYPTVEDLLKNLTKLTKEIRQKVINFGGGLYNHDLFFSLLKKDVEFKTLQLTEIIIKQFGSFYEFKNLFKIQALNLFGSGWVWLVIDKNQKLVILTLPNQETPNLTKYKILFGIDFWEHAYQKQFTTNRSEYFENIWNCLDWEAINNRI